jgi:predicted small secreted protein
MSRAAGATSASGPVTSQEKESVMKRFFSLFALLVMSVSLGGLSFGCNTMEGAGRDIEKGGEALQDAAD